MKQEEYTIKVKEVELPNKKKIVFPVKVCRPQLSIEQPVYSLCYARCVDKTMKFKGASG